MSGSQKVDAGYQPTGQAGADTAYQSILKQLSPYVTQGLSNITTGQNLAANVVNNPYTAGAQAGANTAGAYATGTAAPADYAAASNLNNLGNTAAQGARGVDLNFNTNGGLYAQQYQQMLDQQNAINSMYGVGTSPYGAGVTGQVATDFNNKWLQNAVGLQNTAANTYSLLNNTAASDYSGANNLNSAGLSTYTGGSQLPYQTYAGNAQTGLSALGGLASLYGGFTQPASSQLSNLAQYLGLGQSATGLAQNATNANNQANNSFWGGIGNMFGTIGSAAMFA